MITGTKKSLTPDIGVSELSKTTIFELLSDERRRYVLHYLSRKVGAVDLDELVEQIAHWESDSNPRHHERIRTGLYHHHLPRLVDAGVVRYDPERETVELRDAAEKLAPYLKLSASEDIGA